MNIIDAKHLDSLDSKKLSDAQIFDRTKVERLVSKFLDNPDLTLKKERAIISIYERLLYDSRVWSALKKLSLYLQNFDWRIVSKDKNSKKREIKFFENLFYDADFVEKCAFPAALVKFFGYGVAEMVVSIDTDYVSLLELRFLPQRWFEFDVKNNLCWCIGKTSNKILSASVARSIAEPIVVKHANANDVTDINELKIILLQHFATYDNPYGEGDASRLFYEVMYRNAARQFRAYALERFGLPTVHVAYPVGATKERIQEATDAIAEYLSKGVIALPENYKVNSYSAQVDNGALFSNQIDDADRLIQDIILLQSAGQDLQRVGARAAIETFETATYKGVWAAKKILEQAANKVIQVLCTFNGFSRDIYFELYDEQKVDLFEQLKLDEKIIGISGVKFEKSYWIERYKLDPKHVSFPEDNQTTSQTTPQNAPQDTSQTTPQNASQNASQNVSGNASQNASQNRIEQ